MEINTLSMFIEHDFDDKKFQNIIDDVIKLLLSKGCKKVEINSIGKLELKKDEF